MSRRARRREIEQALRQSRAQSRSTDRILRHADRELGRIARRLHRKGLTW